MPTVAEKKAIVSGIINPKQTGQQAFSSAIPIETKRALVSNINKPVTVAPVQAPVNTPKTISEVLKGVTSNPFSNPYNVQLQSGQSLEQTNKMRSIMKLPALTKLPENTVQQEMKQRTENSKADVAYANLLKKIEFKPSTDILGSFKIPKAITPTVTKTATQSLDEHIDKYQSDPVYRNDFVQSIKQKLADEMVFKNEADAQKVGWGKGELFNDIMAFEGNFVDGLTQGAFTSGLFKEISDPYSNIPSYKQTLQAFTSKSPLAGTVGNLAGSLVSQIAIQGMALKTLNAGLELSKVSLATKTVANLNKIAIGVATAIPQSIFQRDSVKQLWDEKGQIGLEIARNAFSWYLGGNLERAMDNALGKLVTSEATMTGLRKLAYASLTKAPIFYRALTEGAETLGQTIGSIALGQTEYLTDPAYLLQNVGMDMLMLTVSGLTGVDGTNKAAIAKGIKKIRTEFDTSIKGADVESTDLVIARANAAQQIDELVSKYNVKNLQMVQVSELAKDLLTLNVDKIQAQTTSMEESGRLSQMEQAANDDIAYQQTKDLAKQEPEVAKIILQDRMAENPPSETTSEAIQSSKFDIERVNQKTEDYAKSMTETFGTKIMFGKYDNQEVNSSFRGAYTAENDTITINSSLNDVDAYETIISHEILHSLKTANPKAYESLVSYIDETKLVKDVKFNEQVALAKSKKNQGDDTKVLDNAKEEYLGDLFMAMYKLDKKFIDKAIKKDKKMVESILNNIKRMRTIKANAKDMPILTAFKEINGLSQAMESALYKFANEPEVKFDVTDTNVGKMVSKTPNETTPKEVKAEPIIKTEVQTKPEVKQPSTTSQEAQQGTSIAKEGKVPIEKAKAQESPIKPLPKMLDNNLKPLSEYADSIYHETNNINRFINKNANEDMKNQEVYMSNTPDLALGQGENQGFLLKFSTDRGLQGQVDLKKPIAKMLYDKGQAELITRYNDQKLYKDSLVSVTAKKNAMKNIANTGMRVSAQRILSTWDSVKNPDGSITYTKPVDVVKPTAEDVKYSQQLKDIMQSAITTMSAAESVDATKTADRIKEQIGEGVYDRQIKSSKAFEQKAVDFLNENPDKIDSENNRIISMLESGKKIDSEGFASAIALMKHYLKVDDVKNAENIFSLYIPAMSEQGRSLQAGKLLASTTPPGYLKVVESLIRRLNESGKKKYGKNWANVELTAKERASILGTNMNDTKMRDFALLQIGQRIASQMPHNAGDYLNAWRKLSMLSSVRTHARNFLSNVLYVPTQNLNNAISTTLEKTIKIGTSAETTPWSVKDAVQTIGDGFKRLNKNADLAVGSDWSEITLTSKSLDAVQSTNPNRPEQVEALRTMLKSEINGQLEGKSADYFAKNKIIDTTIDNWVTNNKGIDTATRTHALTRDAKLNQMIADDFKTNIRPTLSRLNTDTITTRNVFGVEVMPFGNKKGPAQILNRISSFNSRMLNDVEDVPFYGLAYKMALNRYMKANSQTEITPVAREIAIKKALEATYKQNYAFVTAVENLKKLKYGGNVVDVIMPFTRTPINIIMRGIENSPIGLAKGIFEAGKFMFGKSTAYEVNGKTRYRGDIEMLRKSIDDVAAGIGGTVVVALGAMAFQAGIVTGPPEDEYRLADYRKQVGEAPYALHLGNLYFPLDWIQPTITPFITGLSMAQAMIKSGINPDGILKAATAGGNVVLNLPFLSTLQDLLSTNSNAGGSTNALYDALGKLGTSYVSQMIPTAVGDVNRAIDNTQRSIYTPQDATVEGEEWYGLAQKLPYAVRAPIRSIMSKVAPQLLEAKVDIWGNKLKRSPTALANVAQSMLAPFLATQDKKTAVDKELIRLSGIDSTNTSMYPKVSPKSVSNTYNGVSTQYALNTAEYAGTWQKTAGQTAYKTIDTLIKSSVYGSVDDTLKAKAYSLAHGYAKVKADNQILKSKGVSGIVLNSEDDKIAEKLIELYIVNKKLNNDATNITYPRIVENSTIAYSGKTYAFTQSQKNDYETLLGTTTRTALSKVFNSSLYQKAKPDKQLVMINKAVDDSKDKTTRSYMMKYKSKLTVKK